MKVTYYWSIGNKGKRAIASTPSSRPTIRIRANAISALMFSPVGRFNVLTLLSAVIGGMILIAGGMSAEENSVAQVITIVAGLTLFVSAMVLFASVFSKPHSKQEADRHLIASSGKITPTRIVKNNPERVEAYHRFVNEVSLTSIYYKETASFWNAGELILSGKLTEDDTPLIVASIQQGAVTKEDITASVKELRENAVIPLLGGML